MKGPATMETAFQSLLLPGSHTEGDSERKIKEKAGKRLRARRNPPAPPCSWNTQPLPSSSPSCCPWVELAAFDFCSFSTIWALFDTPKGIKLSFLHSINPEYSLPFMLGWNNAFFFFSPLAQWSFYVDPQSSPHPRHKKRLRMMRFRNRPVTAM